MREETRKEKACPCSLTTALLAKVEPLLSAAKMMEATKNSRAIKEEYTKS